MTESWIFTGKLQQNCASRRKQWSMALISCWKLWYQRKLERIMKNDTNETVLVTYEYHLPYILTNYLYFNNYCFNVDIFFLFSILQHLMCQIILFRILCPVYMLSYESKYQKCRNSDNILLHLLVSAKCSKPMFKTDW